MEILADIILIICLLLFIVSGYKKGLTGCLFRLVSFAIAIVLAILLYKPISNFIIDKTDIDDNIKYSVVNMISKSESSKKVSTDSTSLQNTIVNNINSQIDNATEDAKNTIIDQSATKISLTIINIFSALLVFIIAKIILSIIKLFMKGITSLPVIKQIDKFGGTIFGIVEGFIITYIILGIISFSTMIWPSNDISMIVSKSAICGYLYNNNVLISMIFK